MKYTILLLLILLSACEGSITPGAWATAVEKCNANGGVAYVTVGSIFGDYTREFIVTCKNTAVFKFRHSEKI